ncbi:5'-adenylylsulfate reductase-like 5 [Rhodamnia argentea]|uniref:5'-adenylylsulfate reductase-like 5 n=1 Tax=Rhodamnia argentea TaxID=178133 RepID=A0A8B8N3D7_9MYRT|nr:5'-adenylylsulfate reductase-like 5 [Rhodamnia argentea]
MASPSVAASLLLVCIGALSPLVQLASSESASVCPREPSPFLISLQSQCSGSISPSPPLQVDGNFLDRFLTSEQHSGYTAVLFYASWCPFSQSIWPAYEALSSMFPQIDHLVVEQSLAMPSVFSIYGIRSLPSILLLNQTSRLQYSGPKTLDSLVEFYETHTGLRPVQSVMVEQPASLQTRESSRTRFEDMLSMKNIRREPYLALSLLFACLRLLMAIFPKVVSCLKAFCVSYVPHLNLEIFGEATHLLGRAVHAIDVRRIWTKVRLGKARSFHERAKSARVWASSLASVSLGESSSARSLSS